MNKEKKKKPKLPSAFERLAGTYELAMQWARHEEKLVELVALALGKKGQRVVVKVLRLGAIARNHNHVDTDIVGAALIGKIGLRFAVQVYEMGYHRGEEGKMVALERAASHLSMDPKFLERALEKRSEIILEKARRKLARSKKRSMRKEKKKRSSR